MAATKAALTFEASSSNAAGATKTGASVDLTTAYEAGIIGKITNGATGPTVGCDFVVEVSHDNSNWYEFARVTAPNTSNGVYHFPVHLPDWVMYARSKFIGNTGQTVTVEAYGSKISGV